MKKKLRIVLFIFLAIMWMFVIFIFSSQSGETSSGTSGKVTNFFISLFIKDKYLSWDPVTQNNVYNMISHIVRKTAHFTEYAILYLLLYLALKAFIGRKYIYLCVLIFVIGYAALDEYHQIFVGGRTGQFLDVVIDSCGGLVMMLILAIIQTWKETKRIGKKVYD